MICKSKLSIRTHYCFVLLVILVNFHAPRKSSADGKVVRPVNYKGSLEELSQEAIIVFNGSDESNTASQDLVLKIQVEGEAEKFAWIIPFPNEPKITKQSPKLFKELYDYVEKRNLRSKPKGLGSFFGNKAAAGGDSEQKVEVISRQIVGEFDTAIVRENAEGGLNPWLEKEGYETLKNAEDIIGFYRKKKYVFACIKVSSEALKENKTIDSHPLCFSFDTGGRDGIYFPMKMTSLQTEPFDVNLYVFYRYWLNDKLSKYGYRHRGFDLKYRDWDTNRCLTNGGKAWSLPEEDPFLVNLATSVPTVTKFFQNRHPGKKYYLTNIQSKGLKPDDVRQWKDDLWLFPYYTNRAMVPYDARTGGPAQTAYSSE